MIRTDLGAVTAYAIAVAHGYTGTEAEFAEEIANASVNAQSAASSASAAAQSAADAQNLLVNALDTTLSIPGKAADAGAVNDLRNTIDCNYGAVPTDLETINDIQTNSLYFVSRNNQSTEDDPPTDSPFLPTVPFWVRTYIIGSTSTQHRLQFAFPWKTEDSSVKYRVMKSGTWTDWYSVKVSELDIPMISLLQNIGAGKFLNANRAYSEFESGAYISYDLERGMYHVSGSFSRSYFYNLIAESNSLSGFQKGKTYNAILREEDVLQHSNDISLQVFVNKNVSSVDWQLLAIVGDELSSFTVPTDAVGLLFRIYISSGSYDTYVSAECVESNQLTPRMAFDKIKNNTDSWLPSCDLDDVINGNHFYLLTSGETYEHFPDASLNAGFLLVLQSATWGLQIFYHLRDGRSWIRTFSGSQFVTNWTLSQGGGGSTTTIVQEVSRDTYNNTYDLNVSPAITTDTNGWLQPVDTDTADETGKTDMTPAIMAMLNSTGYCHLAPGIYYVSGNIDMPADSMIEGCGKQTIIRLLQSVTSGYIVRMHTRSTLKNVCLSGGYSDGDISDGNIGGRKGINFIGNRDGQNPEVTPATCLLCQIEGCWFENLDSGFYGYNAGGGIQNSVEVSNCYFSRCKAGINIDYWTEYSKFVNCITFQCYYGCINNGGNNVFMNCSFHAVIGFLIDNSTGDKPNSAHGSVIGCTFNHIDNINHPDQLGKGIGIKVLNITAGFLFANCQLWYGRIYIENSQGVQITGCEIGGLGGSDYPFLETRGSGMVFVDNCLFQSAPSNALSSPTKFTNCWTYGGVAVSA